MTWTMTTADLRWPDPGQCPPCPASHLQPAGISVFFAGHFSFAHSKSLPPHVDVSGLQPPRALDLWTRNDNPWLPTPDRRGITDYNDRDSRSGIELGQALEWIQLVAQHLLSQFGLKLEGEMWYQGFDTIYVDRRLDTGRFYADAHGSIAMQPIKLCPGVFGAAACNNVALLQPLPLHTLMATDAFGRSVAMLAAMFNSWAVLQHLLRLPGGIDWSAIQNTQGPLNTAGRSALHYLCHNPPTAATAQQHAETISMLPDTIPAPVLEAEDDEGMTPLLLAVTSRNLALVEWLLAQGVDPDDNISVESSSRWPVIEAVRLKSAQILERLLNCGATVHCRDEYDRPPVSHALDLQHAEHLRLLVMHGADLDEHKIMSTVYEHIRYTPSHNHDQPMRQCIKELPLRSAGGALRAAVAQGLAARRHLVVLILGTRVACSLSQDVMQLICQYASLMP